MHGKCTTQKASKIKQEASSVTVPAVHQEENEYGRSTFLLCRLSHCIPGGWVSGEPAAYRFQSSLSAWAGGLPSTCFPLFATREIGVVLVELVMKGRKPHVSQASSSSAPPTLPASFGPPHCHGGCSFGLCSPHSRWAPRISAHTVPAKCFSYFIIFLET